MMNRRKFLQGLGLGIASTTAIGKLFESVPTKPSIPEYDIVLKSTPVVAKPRKLKAVWTVELEQDLKAFHSTAAERELAMIIQRDIDREILTAFNQQSI